LPNYPLFRFPLAPLTFFPFFAIATRFPVARRFVLATGFVAAARFAVDAPFAGFVAVAATLAPLPPPATPVIPTEAGRRICFSASLLRSSRPAKWRDLSSLFISVKTQFEDKTGAKQKRPEVLLRAVLITKSLSVNS
jgi:hypothetical protein